MGHVRTHMGHKRTHMGYLRTHKGHIRTHIGHIRTHIGSESTVTTPVRKRERAALSFFQFAILSFFSKQNFWKKNLSVHWLWADLIRAQEARRAATVKHKLLLVLVVLFSFYYIPRLRLRARGGRTIFFWLVLFVLFSFYYIPWLRLRARGCWWTDCCLSGPWWCACRRAWPVVKMKINHTVVKMKINDTAVKKKINHKL